MGALYLLTSLESNGRGGLSCNLGCTQGGLISKLVAVEGLGVVGSAYSFLVFKKATDSQCKHVHDPCM